MFRFLITLMLLGCAGSTWADKPQFSLSLTAGEHRSSSPAQETQRALWNDPMIRLMRAMDAEFSHFLIGQPGGRTPPIFVVGLGGGRPPRLLSAAFENSVIRNTEPPAAVVWPWLREKEPAPPPMEEQLALLLGKRLERRLGSTVDP